MASVTELIERGSWQRRDSGAEAFRRREWGSGESKSSSKMWGFFETCARGGGRCGEVSHPC
jgi:hypothetical protein